MNDLKYIMKKFAFAAFASAVVIFLTAFPLSAFAQDSKPVIDRSSLPESASGVKDFVPAGWKLEQDIIGDLNQDGVTDHALKLMEKGKSVSGEDTSDKNRALIIVFGGKDGKMTLSSVSNSILQCGTCGGAFYGVVDAPSNVTISKGVLVIQQDHGSRWTTDLTYRFRYDEQPSMFILIGFDYVSNDRAAGGTSTESTNYLTGKRITTVSKNSKSTTKTAVINKMRYSLEEVDTEKFEEDATKRLGLD